MRALASSLPFSGRPFIVGGGGARSVIAGGGAVGASGLVPPRVVASARSILLLTLGFRIIIVRLFAISLTYVAVLALILVPIFIFHGRVPLIRWDVRDELLDVPRISRDELLPIRQRWWLPCALRPRVPVDHQAAIRFGTSLLHDPFSFA